jgi:hypothetical protein
MDLTDPDADPQHWYLCTRMSTLVRFLPLSSTRGAWGPMSMATAPAPPLGRAAPAAYTAISAHTASASRPSHALHTRTSRLYGWNRNEIRVFFQPVSKWCSLTSLEKRYG